MLQGFNNVADTNGNSSPGHLNFVPYGVAFVDPAPQPDLTEFFIDLLGGEGNYNEIEGGFQGTNGVKLTWDPSTKYHISPHWDLKMGGEHIRLTQGGRALTPDDAAKFARGTSRLTGTARTVPVRRGGSVSPDFLKTIGTGVIVAGVSYVYDDYVGTGERVGIDLATKVGLGRAIQIAFADNLVPDNMFTVVTSTGREIHVNIVPNGDGQDIWYLTAYYTVDRWSIFWGSYTEVVQLISGEDHYRLINTSLYNWENR